jgi:hypothetical protein
MGPDLEVIVDVVRRYMKGVPMAVLLVYCCTVSQCHGATDPDMSIVLGVVAGKPLD